MNDDIMMRMILAMLVAMAALSLSSQIASAQYWVNDPTDCPSVYQSQDCSPNDVCGYSDPTTYCYDTSSFSPPSATETSDSGDTNTALNGGFVLNCYAYDGSAPHCDNSGNFWCDRNDTCYSVNRQTNCTGGSWGLSECHTCRSGYTYCDGLYTDADGCEVQIGVTDCSGGANNTINSTCGCECDSGYYDCDSSGAGAGNGCEILNGSECTDGGTGLPGTWNGPTCTCEIDKSYFETGTLTKYSTTDPLLWGLQASTGYMMNLSNGTADFIIDNDGCIRFNDTTTQCTASIGGGGNTTDEMRAAINGSDSWFTSVGIGTETATAPLTVQTNSNGDSIRTLGRASDDINQILFLSNSGSIRSKIKAGDYLSFFVDGNEAAGSESFHINSSGSVGIGTTSPESILHLKDSDTHITLESTGVGDASYGFFEVKDAGGDTMGFAGFDSGVNSDFTIRTYDVSDGIDFQTDGSNSRMYISQSGNVGIGTLDPNSKFDLQGNASIKGDIFQNATVPVHAGAIEDGGSVALGSAYRVQVSGKYAYVVAETGNALEIIDISDPSNPTHVGAIIDGDPVKLGGARSVHVSGKYAYVPAYDDDALEIIDISDPSNPTHAGALVDGGSVSLDRPTSLYVSGKYAYVTVYGDNSLTVVDISDPSSPFQAGIIIDGDPVKLFRPYDVYVSGEYAYVAVYGDNAMEIVNVTDPTNPTHAGAIEDGDPVKLGGAYAIYVSDGYAYVASYSDSALEIINVSDPTNPTHAGAIEDGDPVKLGGASGVHVSGKYAYVSSYSDSAVEFVDISDPSNPTHVGAIVDGDPVKLSGARDIYVSGTHAYVASDTDNALEILSITGTDLPAAVIGTVTTGSLNVWEDVQIANDLSVGSGVTVGPRGIYSQGQVAVDGSVNVTSGNNVCIEGGNCLSEIFTNGTDAWFTSVGVGTSSPDHLLEISDSSTGAMQALKISNAQGSSGDSADINFEIGNSAGRGAEIVAERQGTDGVDLVFKTITNIGSGSNVEALRIDEDGYVGIGTTSPSAELEISSDGDGLIITDSGDSENLRAELKDSAGNGGYFRLYDDSETITAFIRSYAVSDVQAFFTAGNVGIGTTSPQDKLQVEGGLLLNASSTGNPSGIGESLQIRYDSGYDAGNVRSRDWDAAAWKPLVFEALNYTFYAGGTDTMVIQDGKVGIGTSSPAHKFSVSIEDDYDGISMYRGGTPLFLVQKSGAVENTSYLSMNSLGSTTVRIHANGSSYFNAGNVGIGTSNPSGIFHIVRNTSRDAFIRIESNNSDSWTFGTYDFAGDSDSDFYVSGAGGSSNALVIKRDTGNVGIGAIDPNATLDVGGSVSASETYIFNDGSTQSVASMPSGNSWYTSTASYSREFSVLSQENGPWDLFFKPDGTKMYILGDDGDEVNEYDLSTPWNVSSASYVQLFSVAGQETTPRAMSFKPDGTKMYVVGISSGDVNEYDLSTPWNASSASFIQAFDVIGDGNGPAGLSFKPDGSKMYVLSYSEDEVNEYDLSTPWNVSSASHNQLFSVAPDVANPNGLSFKPDGTKMYVLDNDDDNIHEYDLSVPWNVSSAYYNQIFFNVGAEDQYPTSLSFKPDGVRMYLMGNTGKSVYEYDLGLYIPGNVGIGTLNPSQKLEVSNSTYGITFDPHDDSYSTAVINTTGGSNLTIHSSGGNVIIKLGQ